MDILPTAAGLAGIPYENATLGRDIFNGAASGEHFAFIRRPPHFGLVGNRFFLSLEPDGTTKLYPYREPNACEDVSVHHPEEAARMSRLCRGILETSRFLLYRSEAKQ